MNTNNDLLNRLSRIKKLIGNTPFQEVSSSNNHISIFAKLESFNMLNNVKVRPAYYIIEQAIKSGEINQNTTVIESSSGNFGVSLATICNLLQLKFIAVIDPNISPTYDRLLNSLCKKVIKVSKRDDTGGFLKTRLSAVHDYVNSHSNVFWTNQYENHNNFMAHYLGLGDEIASSEEKFDYIFLAVSTLGTISGVSKRIKEKNPSCKVIAVDVYGSSVFNSDPHSRHIPGIGSSIHPKFLQIAQIDDHILINEFQGVLGCWKLLKNEGIFAGGSSGCVYAAANEYLKIINLTEKKKAAIVFADGGYPYTETIYNPAWIKDNFKEDIKCYI